MVSNGQWSVTSDADWVSVESDPVSGTVRVGAPRNPDAHRNATLTVRATKGSATESCKVTVSQISREENPYYQMLGYYGLHAENWYYGREPIGVSGTGTFCTVEEKEYRKSFYIKNLFLTGTVVEATYDKNTQTMSIELGRLCYTREISLDGLRASLPVLDQHAGRRFPTTAC
ncbi:MAG: BACON domain-containing protein [Alistipes shahii]